MRARLAIGGYVIAVLVLLNVSASAISGPIDEWRVLEKNPGSLGLTWSGTFANSGAVGFICGKKPRSVLAILSPPPALYANARESVAIVVDPNDGDHAVLRQDWRNGYKYVYQNDKAQLDALFTFLRSQSDHGVNRVSFVFSGAADGNYETTEHVLGIDVPLHNFISAHDEWQRRCEQLQ